MSEYRQIDVCGVNLLNQAREHLLSGDTAVGMSSLSSGLDELRHTSSKLAWRKFIEDACIPHPLRVLLHEDPFTRHAYDKPRGYSGDAHLIDYIYGNADLPEATTVLGRSIHAFSSQTAAPHNVRARRDLLSAKVDEVASRVHRPRILSVACGHLREASLSHAVQEGQIGEYIGMDQDKESVALVNSGAKSGSGVRAVVGSVASLLSGKSGLGLFDFVYSAGLYDYLEVPIAKRLTKRLFEVLKPGGELLIGNFAPCLPDIGYMEAFMGWNLIYRDEAAVLRLLGDLPKTVNSVAADGGCIIDSARLFRTEACTHNNVVYLNIVK